MDHSPASPLTTRRAGPEHVGSVRDILHVCSGIADVNWLETTPTDDLVRSWLAGGAQPKIELIVALDTTGTPVAFVGAEPFRTVPGFERTASHSIYVGPAAQGAGAGRVLIEALGERLAQQGFRTLLGVVDAANEASRSFHERMGFSEFGPLPGIGTRFGESRDAVLVLRALGPVPGEGSA